MARYLFIVARERAQLFAHLQREFAGSADVEVLLDRRRGERRERLLPHEPDRRQADRRGQRGGSSPVRGVGVGASLPVLIIELAPPVSA